MNRFLFLLFICTFAFKADTDAQGTQLLRQPTLSDNSIVFAYANDLWIAARTGGDATRLTSNEGQESNPHFSPDGKWIAFTGQYDGNTDIYLLPSEGGSPQRLTWHPGGDFVTGWTQDGKIIFRSGREGRPTQTNKFYTISPQGGMPTAMDIPRAAYGELSDDGKHIAYVPITSWDPEWRNYRGGQAMPIWIVNMDSKELTRTPQPTGERHLDPVWIGSQVFYLSERDYASNIWSYDLTTGEEKQHTTHKKFDVKSLDAHGTDVIYEQGGYLHLLNTASGTTTQVEINVKGDMNFARDRWERVNGGQLSNAYLSPNGKRAIMEYRGEILTFPKEKGSFRNLTQSSTAAERAPSWSPDGDKIAYFSDESGEYQLMIADQDGGNRKAYDLAEKKFYFTPEWSPDGKHIVYTDTDYNVWVFTISSGATVKVDTDRYAHPNRTLNPTWSPDGKWVAYARQLDNHFKAAFIYNIDTRQKYQVTDAMADIITPTWDVGGKYLYFLASTDYGLNSGWLDMSSYDPSVNRNLYALILDKENPSPIVPESDDEEVKEEDKEENKDKGDKKEDAKKEDNIVVTTTGFAQRIVALNMPSGNYSGLMRGPENSVFVGKLDDNGASLHKYTHKGNEAKEFIPSLFNATTSSNGKHILYRQGSSWKIAGTGSKPGKSAKAINTNVRIKVNPQQEYHQIFKEGWRHMRDFLYVDNVHGAPWDKVYEWYAPWINHVRHRSDLNYVVDIMSGEVAIGHSYVSGGDMPDIDRVPIGLLGCDLEIHQGRFRIKKIYTGESWNPSIQAPLATPGLKVNEGDYILAVNNEALTSDMNPYSLFEMTAGQNVALTVSSTPSMAGSHDIMVEPIRSEAQLRRFDWIEGNRRKVDELSGGKLAYVYIPNTGGQGFSYFNRYYFSQQDKKGAILDERNNGGGSAADYMIDVMSRTLFGYFNSKAGDKRPWTTPISGIWGPKVMIINERAGSGGDLLPYMFHAKGIGPLVGTKTWGGLVGTWDTPPLLDGGRMVAPRGGFFDADGNWAVEAEGVAPDIEVIQEPKLVLSGRDPQLEAAVKKALDMLKTEEFIMKPEPAPPVRWKRPEGFDPDKN